jgi:hypothetical protein
VVAGAPEAALAGRRPAPVAQFGTDINFALRNRRADWTRRDHANASEAIEIGD